MLGTCNLNAKVQSSSSHRAHGQDHVPQSEIWAVMSMTWPMAAHLEKLNSRDVPETLLSTETWDYPLKKVIRRTLKKRVITFLKV